MNEATCKAALCKLLRATLPGAVVYRHEDQFTAGIPDISVTWRGRTVWVEVKLDRPGRRAVVTAAQALALRQLEGMLVTYGIARDGSYWVRVQDGGFDCVYPYAQGARRNSFNHVAVVGRISDAVQRQRGA